MNGLRYKGIAHATAYRLTWADVQAQDTTRRLIRAGFDGTSPLELYSIHDSAGTPVYVGVSRSGVLGRLCRHVGPDPSPVGKYIIANRPTSDLWVVTLYALPSVWESLVIAELQPYFNTQYAGEWIARKPNPLPTRYAHAVNSSADYLIV